jgi:hypothetical protein
MSDETPGAKIVREWWEDLTWTAVKHSDLDLHTLAARIDAALAAERERIAVLVECRRYVSHRPEEIRVAQRVGQDIAAAIRAGEGRG